MPPHSLQMRAVCPYCQHDVKTGVLEDKGVITINQSCLCSAERDKRTVAKVVTLPCGCLFGVKEVVGFEPPKAYMSQPQDINNPIDGVRVYKAGEHNDSWHEVSLRLMQMVSHATS